MATRNLSDLLRALLALVRTEIAEWKRAFGWAVFYIPVAFSFRRATVKQTSTETV